MELPPFFRNFCNNFIQKSAQWLTLKKTYTNKTRCFYDVSFASAQYKWKRLVLRLELDNLLNQRHYAYTIFNGINTYTYDYTLCGRTIMMRATFKL